jgi:hypothetical protein
MLLHIDLNAERADVTLRDVDNFRAFQIEAVGHRHSMDEAIVPYGRWDGDHVWLRPDAVKEAAGARGRDAEWQAGFQAMITYAEQHGYLGDDGSLRAHVERRH